jgi:hypothetical protein
MYNSGPMDELSVEILARDPNCQTFPLNFQWPFTSRM